MTNAMRGSALAVVIGVLGMLVLVGLGLGGCAISVRNDIIRRDEEINAKWSEVKNQYKRRADLVPNLVKTVKAYMKHEEKVLTEITEARSRVGRIQAPADLFKDPEASKRFFEAQARMGSALSRLLVTVERYPQLQASRQFKDLMVQLEGTENRIGFARHALIEAIKKYNQRVRTFPGSLFGFDPKPQLEFPDEERIRKAPDVGDIFGS